MNKTEALLAQLHDIQEPIPPTGLPNSFWLITTLATAVLVLVVFILFRRIKRPASLTPVQQQVAIAQQEDSASGRLRLARLLRQQLLLNDRDNHSRHTTGDEWLNQLDTHFNTTWFSTGDGRQFGNDLYTAEQTPLTTATCQQVQQFLEQENSA